MAALAAGVTIGVLAPGSDGAFEALIYPVLGALLYATFLQDPAVELGVLMVLLTPCIDYVIVFTRLAGGSDRRLLAAAPLLMLAQMVLLPAYLWVFMGPELARIVEPGPFLEAFALLIVLPLGVAWGTEAWAARSPAGAHFKRAVDRLPVALMALTLLVVVASQFPRVRHDLEQIAGVIVLFAAFLLIMPVIGWALARRARFEPASARALVFTGATRNSLVVLPLALALDNAYALTAAVIVTQTLVEVLGMVVYVRVVPRLIPAAISRSRAGSAFNEND